MNDDTAKMTTAGLRAHPSPVTRGMPLVQGKCPACGAASLFLGSGGYVTCSILRCKAPGSASDMLFEGRWPS